MSPLKEQNRAARPRGKLVKVTTPRGQLSFRRITIDEVLDHVPEDITPFHVHWETALLIGLELATKDRMEIIAEHFSAGHRFTSEEQRWSYVAKCLVRQPLPQGTLEPVAGARPPGRPRARQDSAKADFILDLLKVRKKHGLRSNREAIQILLKDADFRDQHTSASQVHTHSEAQTVNGLVTRASELKAMLKRGVHTIGQENPARTREALRILRRLYGEAALPKLVQHARGVFS